MSAENAVKAPMSKKKAIILGIVGVIVVLNVLWTVFQNKVTPKMNALAAEVAKLEARVAVLEGGNLPNMDELVGNLKKLGAICEGQLAETTKAEEARLASLMAELEAQKARVQALKALATPAE